jgi:hypothetical protein
VLVVEFVEKEVGKFFLGVFFQWYYFFECFCFFVLEDEIRLTE